MRWKGAWTIKWCLILKHSGLRSLSLTPDFTSASIPEFESRNRSSFHDPPLLWPASPASLFCPYFFFSSEPTMPTSEPPPINVHLLGANAATGDIPLKLSTSPSFVSTDDERLTVRPRLTPLLSLINHCSLQSKPFITRVTANPSLYVRPRVTVFVGAQLISLWL